MRKLGSIFLLTGFLMAAAPLEKGQSYNFYQKNGQNVLNAELLDESATEYTVKLHYLPKPLKLPKNNLARSPEPIIVSPPVEPSRWRMQKEFRLHAQVGYSAFTFGPLKEIFPAGLQASAGGDWLLFSEPFWRIQAVTVLSSFSLYAQSPRRVQLMSLQAGPKFLLFSWSAPGIIFSGSPLVGMSYASLKGYTFNANYAVFSAQLLLQAEKKLGRVWLAAQVFTNYLFDQSLNFTSTGFSLSVQYPIGAQGNSENVQTTR